MKTVQQVEPLLDRVQIRLITEEDRGRFDHLLETEHYLHSARIGGRSMRYVAEVDGQWVALIAEQLPI